MTAQKMGRITFRYRIAICLITFASSFFFVRIYDSSKVFFVPTAGDDKGYFLYTEAIFRTQTLNWCDRGFTANDLFRKDCEKGSFQPGLSQPYNCYTPGPTLVLLPFTVLGSMLDWLGIVRPTTMDTLIFWSIVGTFFLALGSQIILFEIARFELENEFYALWTTVFISWGSVLAYYVFRRPLMAHASEVFLFLLSYWIWIQIRRERLHGWPPYLALGAVSGLLLITRVNDLWWLGVLALWILFLTGTQPLKKDWKTRAARLVVYGAGILPFVLVFLVVEYLQRGTFRYQTTNYNPLFSWQFMLAVRPSNFRRMLDFLIGPHWGVVGLMPFFGYELWVIFKERASLLRIYLRHPAMWTLVTLGVLLQLNLMANLPNHMSYGFRILLIQYYALHILFLVALKNRLTRGKTRPNRFLWVGALCSILAYFNLMNFESNSTTLTLTPHPAIEAGVYNPHLRDDTPIDAPNYVLHSLRTTLSGKALENLVATPLIAYPLLTLEPWIKSYPVFARALSYYQSEKRTVYKLNDLRMIFLYQTCVGTLLAIGILATKGLSSARPGARRRSKSSSAAS